MLKVYPQQIESTNDAQPSWEKRFNAVIDEINLSLMVAILQTLGTFLIK